MRSLMVLCLLLFLGCSGTTLQKKETNEAVKQPSLVPFYGHWVIKPYFDNLEKEDFTGNLNASAYDYTEIVINPAVRDSLWLIKEDCFAEKVPVLFLDSVTVQLRMIRKTNTVVKFDLQRKLLTFRMDDTLPSYEYSRVEDSSVPREPDVSAFRNRVNCFLARTGYTAYDPLLDQPHGIPCSFSCDGQVKGIKKYRTFRLHFDQERPASGNFSRIMFSDGKNGAVYGLEMYKNGIRLYHLVITSKPYESTIRYRKGDLFLDLERSKK
jgi:hypothetical protein